MRNWQHALTEVLDYLRKGQSLGKYVIRSGLGLCAIGLATVVARVSARWGDMAIELALNDQANAWMERAQLVCIVGGLILISIGVVWMLVDRARLNRAEDRKRLVVVEQLGLTINARKPLVDGIPARIRGQRISLVNDVRGNIVDGRIDDPESALAKVVGTKTTVDGNIRGIPVGDYTLAYGGLMPVPYTAVLAALLNDEGPILVFDWDRSGLQWRSIEPDFGDRDDGGSFLQTGLQDSMAEEAVLTIGVSYSPNEDAISNTFKGVERVDLRLAALEVDNHWSFAKQSRLAMEFISTLKKMEAAGTKLVHVVLAAQNSVVFRLLRAYDGRNMPRIIVYQYEKLPVPGYPWGVLLPAPLPGHDVAKIERRSINGA